MLMYEQKYEKLQRKVSFFNKLLSAQAIFNITQLLILLSLSECLLYARQRMQTVHSVQFCVVQKCSLYLILCFSLIPCMIIQNSSTYRLPNIGMRLCFLNAIL